MATRQLDPWVRGCEFDVKKKNSLGTPVIAPRSTVVRARFAPLPNATRFFI